MSQAAKNGKNPEIVKTPRRRRIFRVVLPAILLALAVLIVLLPYLLPREAMRRAIVQRLSKDANAEVELQAVRFGWLEGLDLSGLRVRMPETQSAVRVERTHIPFEPLRWLARGQVSFVRVEGVKVDLDQEQGLTCLTLPQGEKDKPFPVERVQISGLTVCVNWSDRCRNIVEVPWLELVTDPNKQMINFYGQARMTYASGQSQNSAERALMPAGRFTTQGQLEIVQQNEQQCFAGTIRINWQEVNLSTLRLEKDERLDLARLAGISAGSLQFRIEPNLHLSWELDTSFRGVDVQRRGAAQSSRIHPLRLLTTGNYDPVTGVLNMEKFEINSATLSFGSRAFARFDDTGVSLNQMDVSGSFNTSTVQQIVPALVQRLGPKSDISGPCRFNAQWKGKHPVYRLDLSVDADAVRVSGSQILSKASGVPLKWTFGVHADQSNWPWMAVDRCNVTFAGLGVRGSGTLPRIRPTDDLEWWLDSVRRLGQMELKVESPRVETLGDVILPLKSVMTDVNLTGPASMRLGYAGQEDVGRTDVELELSKGASLAVRDIFTKPVDQKLNVTLQNFWPWNSERPEVWTNVLARCGGAEILTLGKPAKLIWAFSREKNKQVHLDVVGNLETEFRGLEHVANLSPRIKQMGLADRVGGRAVMKLGSAFRLAQAPGGWNPEQARLRLELRNDQTRIHIPDVLDKPAQVPLAWNLDYRLNGDRRTHEVTGVVKWQDLVSRLALVRSLRDGSLSGSYELLVGDLNRTIAALPGLSRKLNNGINAMGKLAVTCRWSGDASGDCITCKIDGTDAGLVMNGREMKLPGVPATFSGELDVPKPGSRDQVYKIPRLESVLGRSFLRLKQGSFSLRNMSGGRWLKMLGVEPWLAWGFSPVEDLKIDLEGRLDTDTTAVAVSPVLEDIVRKYDVKGWVDVDIEAEVANGNMHARVMGRLDNLGGTFKDVVSKGAGTPGGVTLDLFAWPDRKDGKAYFAQVRPLKLEFGPVRASAQADGRVIWSNLRKLDLDSGRLTLDVDTGDLADLSGVSGMASRMRTGGRVSAHVVLERADGQNRLGPSVVEFDDLSAQVAGQPLMLDGTVHLAHDYSFTKGLYVSAGPSMLRLDWQTMQRNGGLLGTAQINTKFADGDQLQSIGEALVSEFVPSNKGAASGSSTVSSKPQPQDEAMAKFQPIRRLAEKSDFLVSMDAKSLRVTDPRSGIPYHLENFLLRLELGKAAAKEKPKGSVKVFSRVSGGQIEGTFGANLTETNPTLVLDSTIDNIKMTQPMRPLVESFFPGLTVKDRVTIKEVNTVKMFTTTKNMPNNPVGGGKMMFGEGYLVGRAAPESIAKIFPGLNFAQYNFSRMHNWFTKRANGVVHNNMIFLGSPWNIYIEGDSKPGGFVEYEIGVDLMARYESEYWSTVGQGRIPLFNTTGRIVNGKMVDQKVKYVPEQTIYSILVKNNAIVGAYRLLMQQLKSKP